MGEAILPHAAPERVKLWSIVINYNDSNKGFESNIPI